MTPHRSHRPTKTHRVLISVGSCRRSMKKAAMPLTRRLTSHQNVRNPRWGTRCSAILAVATLCSALLAPAALAGKPDRLRLGPFESFVDPPGVACPAAIAPEGVRNTYVGGNQALTVFDNGRVMFSGRHTEEITNVATGKSVELDFQGSVAFSAPQPDGSVEVRLSGTSGFLFFAGDVGPGDVATGRGYLFTGNVRLVFGPTGSVIAFESAGTMESICAMIA
jgi:hypothetical protein